MSKKVLIVDDEKSILFALEESLLDEGYDVTCANCAEDALSIFKENLGNNQFKVVLSDMKMPKMSGIELLGKIKELEPSTQVIIITAYGNFDNAVDAVRLGAFDFIQKPFDIEQVKQVVDKAFQTFQPDSRKLILENSTNIEHNNKDKLSRIDIQEKLLPTGESGLGSLSVDVKSVPVSVVGADFYDYFSVTGDKTVIVIGDVGEKGINGSLVMVMVKSLIRSESAHSSDPVLILKRVNSLMRQQGIKDIPVTVFLGILDLNKAVFDFVNAGHEKPFFLNDSDSSGLDVLDSKGVFLGVFEDPELELSSICCRQGGLFLFFTDGLIRRVEKKLVGQNPYEALKNSLAGLLPEKRYSFAETIYNSFVMKDIPIDDDITVMSVYIGARVLKEKDIKCACVNESLILIRSAAEEVLRSVNMPYEKRHEVITALYEALINAVNFAYKDGNNGEIHFKYKIDSGKIFLEVQDFGIGFDMSKYTSPDSENYDGLIKDRGRGIFLMRKLMDNVVINTAVGSGTCVRMEKLFS